MVIKAGTDAVETDEQIFVVEVLEHVAMAESNHRPYDLEAALISSNVSVLRTDCARLGLCSLLVVMVTVDESSVDLASFTRRAFLASVVVSFVTTIVVAVALFFGRDLVPARELESTRGGKSGGNLEM